jgi:hypothetical protein
MALHFEEIDWQDTARGEISLRRRVDPTLGVDVYEVKLGEEFLMSSLFTVAEIELARIGLAQVTGDRIDVLVGGLGLGYTAVAALADPRVQTLTVVDAIAPVINWHQRELLPDAAGLVTDSRAHLLEGDFFALVDGPVGFGAGRPDHYDAILLDIDHHTLSIPSCCILIIILSISATWIGVLSSICSRPLVICDLYATIRPFRTIVLLVTYIN